MQVNGAKKFKKRESFLFYTDGEGVVDKTKKKEYTEKVSKKKRGGARGRDYEKSASDKGRDSERERLWGESVARGGDENANG